MATLSAFFELDPDTQAQRMADAGRRALAHWNIHEPALTLIKYRENAVFALDTGNARYALRVHRQGYHDTAALRSELVWITALGDAGIDVPRIVPATDGQMLVPSHCDGLDDDVQVDLFEWIAGEQLGSVENGSTGEVRDITAIYKTIGQLAAKVHNHASDWVTPAGFQRHAWDEEGLAGEAPLWGRFWELPALTTAQRKLMVRARERVYTELKALDKSPQHYSLIHADFAPENLLVDGDRVRLIDFDDAGFGWHLFELVTSLYFIMGEDHFESARDAMIAGYRSVRPLTDETLERLPLFFLARACTYVGWVHTRPETETARELTPMLVESACALAEDYFRR